MKEIIIRIGKWWRYNFIRISLIIAIILAMASWIFIFNVDEGNLFNLFSQKNLYYTKKFLSGLIGIGEKKPAFRDMNSWKNVFMLTFETLQMSIMAIGFATIGMLLTVTLAAKNAADGRTTLIENWYGRILYTIIRCLYVFTRSVPELIWAMIIVFIFKPGILPGAIALALHNFGILGKLCSEVIEDMDLKPIRNLTSSGASKSQILFYGIIPAVMPKFITYILYRWEVIIRTTIVVGFVGAGGLGQHFKLSMSWFHYTEVTLILIFYVALVGLADFLSEGFRRLVQ